MFCYEGHGLMTNQITLVIVIVSKNCVVLCEIGRSKDGNLGWMETLDLLYFDGSETNAKLGPVIESRCSTPSLYFILGCPTGTFKRV